VVSAISARAGFEVITVLRAASLAQVALWIAPGMKPDRLLW
jgi:hypothetical protein